MKIFKILFIIFFLFLSKAFAFGGGSMGSMGGMGGMGGSGSSTSAVKSGISIVDPEGNEFNCQPFVDKKWDSTSFIDNWNGVYFAIGVESSSFSGDIEIDNTEKYKPNSYVENNDTKFLVANSDLKRPINFSGSSSSPIINLGGGTLIDRVYLGSDLEIRFENLNSTFKLKTVEVLSQGAQEKEVENKIDFSIRNNIIFNAKIGYLINERLMAYFNAGIGSLSSYEISSSNNQVGNNLTIESETPGLSSPIRLSLGGEYLLSNHFRLYTDYSYWIIPKIYGEFDMKKNEAQSSPAVNNAAKNSFSSKFKANSFKFGILYRF